MIELNRIYNFDCLELMPYIEDKSIDMILCDLPYGTTEAVWDSIIDLKSLWSEYFRIIKDNGGIVLTSQNPFTAILVCSQIKYYKHSWIWEKDKSANFLHGNNQPLKLHEEILVFSKGGYTHNSKNKCTYNPILTERKARKPQKEVEKTQAMKDILPRPNNGKIKSSVNFMSNKNLPKSVIYFPIEIMNKLHPTQKPVALFEYLIKTYTDEGETVLDNCAGLGTTAIACINTNRNYILIEKERNILIL